MRRVSLAAALLLLVAVSAVRAEVREVRIAWQFGVAYLPLMVVKNRKLIEEHAEKAGVAPLKVTWMTFGSGADMNTALLASALDFASGGIGPVLNMWSRTQGNLNVKGVAALGSLPLYLNTINPAVKSVRDFTEKDKIALPAVKVSIQAVLLQMVAAQIYGQASYAKLDSLTVSMSHPQATAALLSGGTEITANFSAAPFQNQQLQSEKVRRVLSSYEVTGGPSTLNSLYATARFRDDNPKVYGAVVAALGEAMRIINADRQRAARIYIEEEKSKLAVDFVLKVVSDPDVNFTVAPQGFMRFAEFMAKTGALKTKPASWRDVFFPEIHAEPGS